MPPKSPIREKLAKYFPGYLTLPPEDQEQFEQTDEGKAIVEHLEATCPMPVPEDAPIVRKGVAFVAASAMQLTSKVIRSTGRLLWRGFGAAATSVQDSAKTLRWLQQQDTWHQTHEAELQEGLRAYETSEAITTLKTAIAQQSDRKKQRLLAQKEQHRHAIQGFHRMLFVVLDGSIEQILNTYCTQHWLAVEEVYGECLNCPSDNPDPFQPLLDHFIQGWLPYLSNQLLPAPLEDSLTEQGNQAAASLAGLLFKQEWVRIYKLLKQLGTSHAFIQYMGFATQNEASHLAIIDMFNYWEHGEWINQAKGLLVNILRVFLPLYREYHDIFENEKNTFSKIVRAIVPAIIVLGCLILILTPLAIFGVPEIALVFVALFALFVGLALASSYVRVKDQIIDWARRCYYGGEYQLPDYAVNERLQTLFGERATSVRDLYIEMLKTTKAKQAVLDAKLVFTDEEKAEKETLAQHYMTLILEWVDLHDNPDCTAQTAHAIVKKHQLNQYKHAYQDGLRDCHASFQYLGQAMTFCLETMHPAHKVVDDDLKRLNALEKPRNGLPLPQHWARFWSRKHELSGMKQQYETQFATTDLNLLP